MVSGTQSSISSLSILAPKISWALHSKRSFRCNCSHSPSTWPKISSYNHQENTFREPMHCTKATQNCQMQCQPTPEKTPWEPSESCNSSQSEKKTKSLTYLIHAKRDRQCYARFWHHTKPKAQGGLAFVNIHDAKGNTHTLLDKEEMEDTIHKFSHTHFAKAERSSFTADPPKSTSPIQWTHSIWRYHI